MTLPERTKQDMEMLLGLALGGVPPDDANDMLERINQRDTVGDHRLEEHGDDAWDAGPFEATGTVRVQKVASRIEGRESFEAEGFQFGPPLEDDPLFCEAVFPPNWSLRATDHNMWFEILDDEGNVRATMFYKSAFYDRDAFLRWRS